MAYIVGRGNTLNVKVQFYEYEGGPAYDPTDDNVRPLVEFYFNNILQAGPYEYLNGAGPVVRTEVGSYNYDFSVPSNASLGTWIIRWDGGPTAIEEFELTIVDLDEELNPAADLLKRPTLSSAMRESPLYQTLGVGFTDAVFLIGHAD